MDDIINSRFDNNGFIRLNCTLGHPHFFLRLLSSDRSKFLAFSKKKKRNDVVQTFFTWNNPFNLKIEHSNNIEKNRNKNENIFYSMLCILFIQICECWLLTSSWGTRAWYSETSCDFFFRFFFSIRQTDPMSLNAFDGKRKKKRGWPFYYYFLSLVWLKLQKVFTARKRGHSLESDTTLHVSKVKITLRSQYKKFCKQPCSFVFFVYFIFQVFPCGE